MLWHRKATTSVAAVALLALSSTSVLAATEQQITDALKALITSGKPGTTVELGTPSAEGDALVYKDVTVKSDMPDGPNEAKIGTLTLTGADVTAEGALTAANAKAEGIEIKDPSGDAGSIASAEIVNLSATPGADGAAPSSRFDSLLISDVKFNSAGAPPVTVATVSIEASDYTGMFPRTSSFSAKDIVVDVGAMGDDPTAQQIKALGYDKLVLAMTGNSSWDESASTYSLDHFTIEGKDMGALKITGTFGGLTKDVIAKLQSKDPSADVFKSLSINNASISFTDASITGKLLDMQASQMGADRAAFVEQITAALPLMLTAIGNPDFQNKLATAATAFLKDPKNITISVAPDQPVPFETLATTAQTAPQTLPDILKADVKANEPAAE